MKDQTQDVLAQKVDYGDVSIPSDLNLTPDLDEAAQLGLKKYSANFFWKNTDKLVFKKHVAWTHEHEFRILAVGKTQNVFSVAIAPSLVGIIFGCEFKFRDSTNFEFLKRVLTPNIFELYWSHGNQSLHPM